MEKELKERNGCISFWLWIAIVANIGMSIFYAVTMFSAYSKEMALGLGICSILGAVNVLSVILLLRWNKIGFYMMMVSSIMTIVVNLCVLKIEPVAAIGSLIAILIWWAILQMKKKGVSAWSQLRSGWDVKHCRHLYQLFAGVGGGLFLLTLIAFGQEHNNPFEDIIIKDDTDIEAVDDITSIDYVEIDTVAVVEEETVEEKNTRYIHHMIYETNKAFPQKLEAGITLTKMYMDGDYVMYLAECDEDILDMELLSQNKVNIKQNIKAAMDTSDPEIRMFIKNIIKANKGLGYKYVGDTSGQSVIVRFSRYELEDF